MVNPLTDDDITALRYYTNCYTTDDYETHFICVIITEQFVFVTHTFAENFTAKRKLLKLMKELFKYFNKRVIVGKDSEMFNRYKVPYSDTFDEIILKGKSWAVAEA